MAWIRAAVARMTALQAIATRLLCLLLMGWIGVAAADSPPRGALSPSAPLRMDYTLPDVLPASGELSLTLDLSTPLDAGEMVFEVASSAGVSIIDGAPATYRLPCATTPVPHVLKLLLFDTSERYVIVLLSVDGPTGTGAVGNVSRSYRIDLSPPAATPAASKSVLKLLPATVPR